MQVNSSHTDEYEGKKEIHADGGCIKISLSQDAKSTSTDNNKKQYNMMPALPPSDISITVESHDDLTINDNENCNAQCTLNTSLKSSMKENEIDTGIDQSGSCGSDSSGIDAEVEQRMAKLLSTGVTSDNTDDILKKRASIIESIQWLGRHVPQCVLMHLHDQMLPARELDPGKEKREKQEEMQLCHKHHSIQQCRIELNSRCATEQSKNVVKSDSRIQRQIKIPHATKYKAALLFIDMSGFTKISQQLDVESLSKAINSYFQAIVDEITSHGGEILKFAGDAIFAEWRVDSASENCNMAIKDCVYVAAMCGAQIVKKCSNYPIFAKITHDKRSRRTSSPGGKPIAALNVHCGLGVGEMGGLHVGNDFSRREYLVLGDPIDQVAEACDSAELGELRASKEALVYLDRDQPFESGNGKSIIIASGRSTFFMERKIERKKKKMMKTVSEKLADLFETLNTHSLKYFQELLRSYVHSVVVADETIKVPSLYGTKPDDTSVDCSYGDPLGGENKGLAEDGGDLNGGLARAQERHRSEAELRSVFTIFIMPKIEAKFRSNDEEMNKETFNLLNNIMNVVTSILDNFKGHLRQYIVDDKGVVLIATFGLRGSTFPNMVTERVLPTCKIIHSSLAGDLSVDCQIGVTLGKVYCGVVGSVKRHEYAVLGPSVNLAARLMSQKNHPGVLVDDTVRVKANKFNFVAFPPVKAKGYSDLVPVFKPLTAKEARWGRVNPDFVGREEEMRQVSATMVDMLEGDGASRIFFVWGESGAGKSSFIVRTITNLRKMLMLSRKSSVITRNVCADGDALVPFSLFRSIFRDILSERPCSGGGSTISGVTGSVREKVWDTYSASASVSSMDSEKTSIIGRLREICSEMDAPEGFLEIVGHHLLGNAKQKVSKVEKTPKLDNIISFMAQVFITASCHADIVVLALDDVQYMDKLSWKVVHSIMGMGGRILLVCGSRPLDTCRLALDEDFWEALKRMSKKRFNEVYLKSFEKREIRQLAALCLKCDVDDLDDRFINDVYMHSGGMPYFASMILKNCHRNNLFKRFENNKIGWRPQRRNSLEGLHYANLNELLLQQIDTLDELTRKLLQIASVLGASFELEEILEISEQILCVDSGAIEQHIDMINVALDAAVEVGILEQTIEEVDFDESGLNTDACGGVEEEKDVRVMYSFHHSTWKRLILSLLLDSWKRDIHKHAAIAIEARMPLAETRDYRVKVKLFQHWKESGDTIKAADVALDIGQNYKTLGLNLHSIEVYNDALDMWRTHKPLYEERFAGFAPQVIESLDEENLKYVIKILTVLGQASGSSGPGAKSKEKSAQAFKCAQNVSTNGDINVFSYFMGHRNARSNIELIGNAQAFEGALAILEAAPVSLDVKDRSFIFPIFSGMSFVIKYGNIVRPSEQLACEIKHVANFVNESKKHGDPVHYGRALAMKAETLHREGKFQEAMDIHLELKRVYDVDKHSVRLTEAYASDRCAQDFGFHATCCIRLGKIDTALKAVDVIINDLMPKMDVRNVHNSMAIIYPVIWILKDNGEANTAKEIFTKYVMQPFEQYYGKDAFTPFKPTFRGIQILLDLELYMEGKENLYDENYMDWALDMKNLECKFVVETSCSNFGRGPMSINAEICLKLSKLTEDTAKRRKLLDNGLIVAKRAIEICNGPDGSSKLLSAYSQIEPIYDELKLLIKE